MEHKYLKIDIPEGYEIDNENSTFEKIVFKKSAISYTNVLDELELNHVIIELIHVVYSDKQHKKLNAINRILNVAKYLNGDWKPDFNSNLDRKYYLYVDGMNIVRIGYTPRNNISLAYFKSEELAKQAIEILGEETIKQAFNADY